jgi:hypothetical protein
VCKNQDTVAVQNVSKMSLRVKEAIFEPQPSLFLQISIDSRELFSLETPNRREQYHFAVYVIGFVAVSVLPIMYF